MRWFAGDEVAGMVEPFPDEACEVSVVKAVDDPAAVSAGLDEAREAQLGEVLADRGARCIAGFGERGDVASP